MGGESSFFVALRRFLFCWMEQSSIRRFLLGIRSSGIVCSDRGIDPDSLLSPASAFVFSSERGFALARGRFRFGGHSLLRRWSRGVSSQFAIVVISRGSPAEGLFLPTNQRPALPPLRSFTSIPAKPLQPSSAVMLTESPSLIACEVHERAFHPAHNDTFFGVAYFLTANSRGESKLTDWTLTYSRGEAPMDSVCDDDDRTSFALETASWLQFAVPRES